MAATPQVLSEVTDHLVAALGPVLGRASVTFVGTDRLEILRFGPSEQSPSVRYATLGMSAHPMTDPSLVAADPVAGPRAELVLTLSSPRDAVFRQLAVLAMSPFVEGLVVTAGASVDLQEPLWPGSRCTAVLVGEPAGLVADLPVPGWDPVRFFPVLPMTPEEAAWKRVRGAAALEERWLLAGTDLRDPDRRGVELG